MVLMGGLQKTSLIDYPGNIAATIFLKGCNFRCGFCHNPTLVVGNSEILSEEKVLEFLKKKVKLLDGVVFTGGEPLLNKNLIDFIKKVKSLGYLIKIDTNGSNPEELKELIDNKLVDYIAIDIKSDKANYEKVAGTKVNINKIEESLNLITNSNIEYELRTTVIRGYHNTSILKEIGIWLSKLGVKKYVIQNFIPGNKLLDANFESIKEFSNKELEEMKIPIKKYFKKIEIRA